MNLLITGAWPDAKKHIPELEAMGHSVAFLQQERDELPCDPDCVLPSIEQTLRKSRRSRLNTLW